MYREPTPEMIRDQKLYQEMGLTKEEYDRVVSHLQRLPNWTEIGIYSVMWSEHCSYKNSKPLLRRFPTDGRRVLQGPGEGAGAVDIGDQQAVVFKIESHNHPSAVEPFQGAATGVGGIVRDVFSMGARPVALLNSLRFGELKSARVKYLFKEAVAGIAHYGNRVGIPTVGGEVVFDRTYEGNPLVNAMCVGIVEHDRLQKGIAKGVGNKVVYIGASTGRDGIHGATFASEELSDESEEKVPSVQAGDPFVEKLLLEACLEMIEKELLVGIQDMGAAGLTSSSTEMAAKGKCGLELNLDLVPQREFGMTPYEIMLSESQERMLVVVEPSHVDDVMAICDRWGLQAAVIGEVVSGDRYRLYHQGKLVADIPVQSLIDDAPLYIREEKEPAYYIANQSNQPEKQLAQIDPKEAFEKVLASPNIGSKKWVYEQYDYTAGASTAVRPGSDAGVIVLSGTDKALAMSTDGNGRYVYLDPVQGGRIAVVEAARNVVCSGAEPLGLTNCLNFGSPEKPEIYWQLSKAIDGMSEACRAFEIPVISGNVSLYNETSGEAIYPTPIVGIVGLLTKRDHRTTKDFQNPNDQILLFGDTYAELGGSELQVLVEGKVSGRPPKLDLATEKRLQQLLLQLIRKGVVQSAHDLSEGGLAIALAEACVETGWGVRVNATTDLSPTTFLFSESQSRVIVSVKAERVQEVIQAANEAGVPCQHIGEVVADQQFEIHINHQPVLQFSLARVQELWEEAIPCRMKPSSMN